MAYMNSNHRFRPAAYGSLGADAWTQADTDEMIKQGYIAPPKAATPPKAAGKTATETVMDALNIFGTTAQSYFGSKTPPAAPAASYGSSGTPGWLMPALIVGGLGVGAYLLLKKRK